MWQDIKNSDGSRDVVDVFKDFRQPNERNITPRPSAPDFCARVTLPAVIDIQLTAETAETHQNVEHVAFPCFMFSHF